MSEEQLSTRAAVTRWLIARHERAHPTSAPQGWERVGAQFALGVVARGVESPPGVRVHHVILRRLPISVPQMLCILKQTHKVTPGVEN